MSVKIYPRRPKPSGVFDVHSSFEFRILPANTQPNGGISLKSCLTIILMIALFHISLLAMENLKVELVSSKDRDQIETTLKEISPIVFGRESDLGGIPQPGSYIVFRLADRTYVYFNATDRSRMISAGWKEKGGEKKFDTSDLNRYLENSTFKLIDVTNRKEISDPLIEGVARLLMNFSSTLYGSTWLFRDTYLENLAGHSLNDEVSLCYSLRKLLEGTVEDLNRMKETLIDLVEKYKGATVSNLISQGVLSVVSINKAFLLSQAGKIPKSTAQLLTFLNVLSYAFSCANTTIDIAKQELMYANLRRELESDPTNKLVLRELMNYIIEEEVTKEDRFKKMLNSFYRLSDTLSEIGLFYLENQQSFVQVYESSKILMSLTKAFGPKWVIESLTYTREPGFLTKHAQEALKRLKEGSSDVMSSLVWDLIASFGIKIFLEVDTVELISKTLALLALCDTTIDFVEDFKEFVENTQKEILNTGSIQTTKLIQFIERRIVFDNLLSEICFRWVERTRQPWYKVAYHFGRLLTETWKSLTGQSREQFDEEEYAYCLSEDGIHSSEILINYFKLVYDASTVYKTYLPGMTGANIKCTIWTDGKGNFQGQIINRIGDPTYDEIGVLEIEEDVFIVKVEITGSGCILPVTLTVNEVKNQVTKSHDMSPYGNETLIFKIIPSKVIRIYSSIHNDYENHGFRIGRIVLYRVPSLSSSP